MRYFVQGWLKQDIESCIVSVGGFAFTEQFSSYAMTYISYEQELTLDALLQGVLYGLLSEWVLQYPSILRWKVK